MFNISKFFFFNFKEELSIISRRYSSQKLKRCSVNKERPIITCKRSEYNFSPSHQTYRLQEIKLASKGWHHKKSKGDYLIFHMFDDIEMHDTETSFADSGLSSELITNLEAQEIRNPTLIQCKAIPTILSGQNTLITAETGCGKTLAYLLPAIQQIILQKKHNENNAFNSPMCIILTPSRELAFQVEHVASNLVKHLNVQTQVIVGGGTKKKMLNPTFQIVDILIATLGALSKLTSAGIYRLSNVRHVILDEADTLLDESFSERLSYFLGKLPLQYSNENAEEDSGTQLTLVSATILQQLPDALVDIIAVESLKRINTDHLHQMLPYVPQRFLRLGKSMKPPQLLQMVKSDAQKQYPVIIFSNKASTCDWVSMFLSENGVPCINLNANMSLRLREDRFLRFQRGEVNVISCTDLGSRGLDTTRVQHVINYEFPQHFADYIHRCGRTGRIGSPQNCHITNFISTGGDVKLVQKIEMSVRQAKQIPNVDGNISRIIKDRISEKPL